jgi:hypothetical protein
MAIGALAIAKASKVVVMKQSAVAAGGWLVDDEGLLCTTTFSAHSSRLRMDSDCEQ